MQTAKALAFFTAAMFIHGCQTHPPSPTRVEEPPAEENALPARSAEAQFELDGRLILAAHAADLAEVERLLSMGADPNAVAGERADAWFDTRHIDGGYAPMGSRAWTPLLACTSNWDTVAERKDLLPVCSALLDAGADIDAADSHGATALYNAIRRYDTELALYLIRRGADVNTETQFYIDAPEGSPLWLAARRGDRAVVRALIRAGADVNGRSEFGQPPLVVAITEGDQKMTIDLIDAGADVNYRVHRNGVTQTIDRPRRDCVVTPLQLAYIAAADRPFDGALDALEKAGATLGDPEDVDDFWLFKQILSDRRMVRRLIEHGVRPVSIHPRYGSILHVAASDPDFHQAMHELLKIEGLNIDGLDDYANTPLSHALTSSRPPFGSLDIMKLLLEAGANPNATFEGGENQAGDIPMYYLHTAIAEDYVGAVALLLAYGADPELEDMDGWTPLDVARQERGAKAELITALLQAAIAARETRDQ